MKSQNKVTLGIAAAILSALLFAGMDVFVKTLSHLGTGEITFFRGLIGIGFLPYLARKEGMPIFSGKDRVTLHLRGISGGLGILLFFFSLKGLTLGDAEILAQLCSFFMVFLAPFFLKQNPRGHIFAPLLLIATGAAVILQVWNFRAFNEYAMIGVLSAFSSAFAYIFIGKLTEIPKRHSGCEIVFYFQLYSAICGALLMPFDFVMPRGIDWIFIFGLAVTAIFAQMSFTWGCQHVHPIIISFVMYTGILFHILAGWIIWGETLTAYSWIGGAAIVGGSAWLLWKTK
jgi:drug/metabolite transporter (DMT)-like permease